MSVEEKDFNGDMSDEKLITYKRRRVYNENPNLQEVVKLFIQFSFILYSMHVELRTLIGRILDRFNHGCNLRLFLTIAGSSSGMPRNTFSIVGVT